MFCLGLAATGCVTTPKQTVLNLDTTDRKWTSRKCVAARKEAAEYNDHANARMGVAVAGNLVVPFAGTATSVAWGASQSKSRKRLNHKIASACVSDPLGDRQRREAQGRSSAG
jgi:hypothetical protein